MSFAYLVWQSAAVAALGAALFLWRAGPVPAPLQAWARQVLRALAGGALLALGAGLLVIVDDAIRITGQRPALASALWLNLLTDTRLGQMWLCKEAALLLLAVLLGTARATTRGVLAACMALAATFFAAGAWAGHGGVSVPLAPWLALHVLHGLASAAWLGALPVWASLVKCAGDTAAEQAYLVQALRRFSRFAMVAMAVLMSSGVPIAWRQFGSWPAFFATPAALWLWLKLGMLVVVLGAAWQLRRHHLARLAANGGAHARAAALRVLAVESFAAVVLFGAALQLARGTPGGHEPLHWWLPFRLLPASLASSSFAQWQLTIALLLLACAAPAWWLRYRLLAPALTVLALLLGVQAMAVRAFPSTYTRPAVAYDAPSIARGMALYARHCTACHGEGGRGDGAQSFSTAVAPADLAQHTALHSAGDMFAWLSDGTPGGAMPGFAAVLSEGQRWDLINLLRAFADGHRARIIDEDIAPRRPWLAAPNFAVRHRDGTVGELKDYRGRAAVLLLLVAGGDARGDLGTLVAEVPALRAAGWEVLVVPSPRSCVAAARGDDGQPCVRDPGAVAAAYGLLSRTLEQPGDRAHLSPPLSDAAFLIDRFGYVRGRWTARDGGAPWTVTQLGGLQRALADEPEIRAAPELHVH